MVVNLQQFFFFCPFLSSLFSSVCHTKTPRLSFHIGQMLKFFSHIIFWLVFRAGGFCSCDAHFHHVLTASEKNTTLYFLCNILAKSSVLVDLWQTVLYRMCSGCLQIRKVLCHFYSASNSSWGEFMLFRKHYIYWWCRTCAVDTNLAVSISFEIVRRLLQEKVGEKDRSNAFANVNRKGYSRSTMGRLE